MLTITQLLRAGKWRGLSLLALAAFLLSLTAEISVAFAAPPTSQMTPSFWDPNKMPEKPDLASIRQIRFLTEDDYPPFNFQGPDGQLAGFNVDLEIGRAHV